MYLLEGNIGAGKSTLLHLIKTHLPQLNVVTEPVNAWNNHDTSKSLLAHFYEDQERWGFTMEHYTLLTRVKHYLHEQRDNNHLKIMERSIYSGYYCFAKNGYLNGTLNDEEWHVYEAWFHFLVDRHCQLPTGFIYMVASPECCFARLKQRNRRGEEAVSLEYLRQIHQRHEQFLVDKRDVVPQLKEVPVLILDVNEPFADDPGVYRGHLDAIAAFIGQTGCAATLSQTMPRSPESVQSIVAF